MRTVSAPVKNIPLASCIKITEKNQDNGKLEIIVQLFYSDKTMCTRDIHVQTLQGSSNNNFIKKKLEIIAPVLLSDAKFKDLSLSFEKDNIIITMANKKIINITNNVDNTLGMFIIKQMTEDSKLQLDEVCPILHDKVGDLLKQGDELVRIEGEPHIYHKKTLQQALLHSGQNISPMSRQPISRLLPVVQVENIALPIQALSPPEVTGIDTQSLEINIKKNNPIDVHIVVDVSLSMCQGEYPNMAYLPLKKYIESLDDGSRLEIITFCHNFERSFDLADKNQLDLDQQLKTILEPRGGTAFRDAMIRAISEFKFNKDDRKQLMLVITDGEDYNSKSSIEDLNNVTANAWSKEGKNIECLFMHPPNLNGAQILQLSPDKCLTFQPDPQYTEAAIASLRTVTQQYSLGEPPAITRMMRTASCPAQQYLEI